jgi:hypothetical protein
MAWPKSIKGNIEAIFTKRNPHFIGGQEFEEYAYKYYKRKYGAKHVQYQKRSKTTGKRPDFIIY